MHLGRSDGKVQCLLKASWSASSDVAQDLATLGNTAKQLLSWCFPIFTLGVKHFSHQHANSFYLMMVCLQSIREQTPRPKTLYHPNMKTHQNVLPSTLAAKSIKETTLSYPNQILSNTSIRGPKIAMLVWMNLGTDCKTELLLHRHCKAATASRP